MTVASEHQLWVDGPTLEGIAREVADGFITEREHSWLPLRIYNYSPKAQYSRHWNAETLACRGLILDIAGNPVQRPFGKFFNIGEHAGPIPQEPFDVFEKLDGSLGILYHDPINGPAIATRGSFHSMQARQATQMLRERYEFYFFDPDITYLFEIIYPENRIVVDYGEREDIVLLAMIETATGRELPLSDAPGLPTVEHFDGIADLDELAAEDRPNHEGYVVRFQSGLRLKIKHEEYVRLHRLVTGITPRKVWEILKSGVPLAKITNGAPESYRLWVSQIADEITGKYQRIEAMAQLGMAVRPVTDDRRVLAEHIKGYEYPAVMFSMLDGRDYSEIIWKAIYPEAHRPWKVEV